MNRIILSSFFIILFGGHVLSQPVLKWQLFDTTGNGNFFPALLNIGNDNNITLTADAYLNLQYDSCSVVISKYSSSGQVVWKTAATDTSAYGNILASCIDKNNNHYVAGNLISGGFLSCFDNAGVLKWTDTTTVSGRKIIATDSKNIVVGCWDLSYDTLTLSMYSPAGNLVWTTSIKTGNIEGLEAEPLMDSSGNIYVSGFIENVTVDSADWFVRKYSSAGIFLWQTLIPEVIVTTTGTITNSKLDSKGNVVITGTIKRNSNDDEMALVKINPDGIIKWTKFFPDSSTANAQGNDLAIDDVGNIYVGGLNNYFMFAQKYDTVGNLIWNKKLPDTCSYDLGGFYFEYERILTDKFHSTYLATTTESNYNRYYTICKFDSTGTLDWKYKATHEYGDLVFSDMCLDDSLNIYVTGVVYAWNDITYNWTIKLSQPGINAFEAVQPVKATDVNVSIYPNPVSDNLLVSANSPSSRIFISDILGRGALNGPIIAQSGVTIINVSQLVAGIYIVTVAAENGDITNKKIVKE